MKQIVARHAAQTKTVALPARSKQVCIEVGARLEQALDDPGIDNAALKQLALPIGRIALAPVPGACAGTIAGIIARVDLDRGNLASKAGHFPFTAEFFAAHPQVSAEGGTAPPAGGGRGARPYSSHHHSSG